METCCFSIYLSDLCETTFHYSLFKRKPEFLWKSELDVISELLCRERHLYLHDPALLRYREYVVTGDTIGLFCFSGIIFIPGGWIEWRVEKTYGTFSLVKFYLSLSGFTTNSRVNPVATQR